jgi:hypothetical protein
MTTLGGGGKYGVLNPTGAKTKCDSDFASWLDQLRISQNRLDGQLL